MEFENYYFAGSQDTLKTGPGAVPAKSQVHISHDVTKAPASDLSHKSYDNILKTQEAVSSPKQYYFRRKSLQNQDLINDSTLHLVPQHDYFLQQVEVHPRGIMLPSRPVTFHNNDWMTVLLFFILVLFAVVKYSSKKYFRLLFQSITSYSASSRLYREQNISLKQGSAIMEFFYPLVLALFGFQFITYFGLSLPFSDIISYFLCFGIIYMFLLIKELFYKTLAFMGETQAETNEFLFNVKNHNKVLTILLLPLIGFNAWSPGWNPRFLLYSGIALIAVFYLLYLMRGMKILLKKQYSIFYLFLYLCTLEFLPWVLLLKCI